MVSAVATFIGALEPWIRGYSAILFGVFLLGLLALAKASWGGASGLRAAARRLQELKVPSQIEAFDGASQHTYGELVSIIDSLPDRGGPWWAAVQPTIQRYERGDAATGARIGYFVTEAVDDSVPATVDAGDASAAFAHSVPALLTSLGLLGTFIALMIGLYGLV